MTKITITVDGGQGSPSTKVPTFDGKVTRPNTGISRTKVGNDPIIYAVVAQVFDDSWILCLTLDIAKAKDVCTKNRDKFDNVRIYCQTNGRMGGVDF